MAMRAEQQRSHQGCEGKHPHPSVAAAQLVLTSLSRRTGFALMEVYRCGACGSFHIGHKNKRPRRGSMKVRR